MLLEISSRPLLISINKGEGEISGVVGFMTRFKVFKKIYFIGVKLPNCVISNIAMF